jgi:DNA-directed RNA polymerase subunit alpha
MEVVVQQGRGYVPAAQLKEQNSGSETFGTIFVDAVFSPVINVRFSVEAARVQQRTDYDRLILEVSTNGTVTPEDAVSYAAKVLRDHLNLFISMKDQAAELAALEQEQEAASATSALEEKLDKSIEELELSVRSFNCLEAAGIKTIRDLVQKSESEMLKYRNFGRKSLNEIKNILKEMNLRFGMEIDKETGLPLSVGSEK